VVPEKGRKTVVVLMVVVVVILQRHLIPAYELDQLRRAVKPY